jgi:hypothetical protein
VGEVHELLVRLVPAERTTPSGTVEPLPRPHEHDVTVTLQGPATVTVAVQAEHFTVEGQAHAALTVPADGPSPSVRFRLRAEAVGPGRVTLDLFQNGRPVGAVTLFPEAVASGAERRERGPARPEGGDLVLAPSPPPAPDLVILVFENRYAGGPGRLDFRLHSEHPGLRDLPVHFGDVGTLDLRSDVASWVDARLRPLGVLAQGTDLSAEEVDQTLAGIGYTFFDELLPPELQRLFWTFRQRGVRTVQVVSDEPHIPWELIKPYRKDPGTGRIEAEDTFWGQGFALTHWLRGRPAVNQLSFERVFAVATGAANPPAKVPPTRDLVAVKAETPATPGPLPLVGSVALASADEELAILCELRQLGAGVEVLPARKRELRAALERGGFTVLHLACHGAFGAATADASSLLMEDGEFTAAELSPHLEGPVRSGSPLIFFNACHSGRVGFALTRLGSWGARLVQLGCGCFVGALWPVNDLAALEFARAFYKRLCEGLPVGEAVALARQQVHERYPNDPTWLAYRCFADPLARVRKPQRECHPAA